MNTLLRSLLLTALTISATHVVAHTNKTYLAPRPVGQNCAMEQASMHSFLHESENTAFGGSLQVTGFYSHATNRKDLGSYFLLNEKNSIELTANNTTNEQFNANFILHRRSPVTSQLTFSPTQKIYGARFDYHQNLTHIADSLYIRISLPIASIKNTFDFNVKCDAAFQVVDDFTNYFNGQYEQTGDPSRAQSSLNKAIINNNQHISGAGNLTGEIGYTLKKTDRYALASAIHFRAPNRTMLTGKHVFEPIIDGGNHWSIGASVNSTMHVWKKNDHHVNFKTQLTYNYALQAEEIRTLGVINREFGQYSNFLPAKNLAINGARINTINNLKVIPGANILTMPVTVTPGHNIEFLANICYANKGFSYDVGYNLFWKNAESISRKHSLNNQYYLISTHGASNLFLTANQALSATMVEGGEAFADNSIDANAAATPSALTHKAYGQIGYVWSDRRNPVMLSVGGHYEFAENNAAIENWGFNIKAGISF